MYLVSIKSNRIPSHKASVLKEDCMIWWLCIFKFISRLHPVSKATGIKKIRKTNLLIHNFYRHFTSHNGVVPYFTAKAIVILEPQRPKDSQISQRMYLSSVGTVLIPNLINLFYEGILKPFFHVESPLL